MMDTDYVLYGRFGLPSQFDFEINSQMSRESNVSRIQAPLYNCHQEAPTLLLLREASSKRPTTNDLTNTESVQNRQALPAMSRGKQPTKNASADGKHRKETKEERRVRLEKQAEARDVSTDYCYFYL